MLLTEGRLQAAKAGDKLSERAPRGAGRLLVRVSASSPKKDEGAPPVLPVSLQPLKTLYGLRSIRFDRATQLFIELSRHQDSSEIPLR